MKQKMLNQVRKLFYRVFPESLGDLESWFYLCMVLQNQKLRDKCPRNCYFEFGIGWGWDYDSILQSSNKVL